MVDLNKIAANLVNFVEGKVAEEKNTGVAGRIDTEKGESVFKNVLDAVKTSKNLTDDQVNEIWGFAKSGNTASTASKAPAKAPMKAAENPTATTDASGGINITINDTDNWYINVTVSMELSEDIKNLLEELKNNSEITNESLEEIRNYLKENNEQNNKILELIKGLYDQMVQGNASLETIKDILEGLNITVDQLNEMIADLTNDSLEVLQMMGFNLETLINLVKKSNENDEKQLEMLNTINQSINALTQNFENFSEEQIALFNEVIGKLAQGNESLENIMRLLELIKADTSEGNKISMNILEEVKKGNSNIMNILKEHGVKFDNIIALINKQGQNSDAIKQLLMQVITNQKIENNTLEEILDAIDNIPVGGAADVGDLSEILNKMDTMTFNQDVIIMLLKGIAGKLDTLGVEGAEINDKLAEVLDKLDGDGKNDAGDGYCNVDNDQLMSLLKEILEAVKENKCQCEHGNTSTEEDPDTNESIITDLEGIFKAKGHSTGIEGVYGNQETDNTPRKITGELAAQAGLDPRQTYIQRGNEYYTTNGVRVK